MVSYNYTYTVWYILSLDFVFCSFIPPFLSIDTFLRVRFDDKRIALASYVIIWINLATLLPIACKPGSNELYSLRPQEEILPVVNTGIEPPSQVRKIVKNVIYVRMYQCAYTDTHNNAHSYIICE